MTNFKVTITNITNDKILDEQIYDLETLLTSILNKLEDKENRDDYLGSWRSFSVEVVEQ